MKTNTQINSKLILLLILFGSMFNLHAQNNIRMTSFYNSIDKAAYYLVWDIKTGKSAQYYWNATASKWDKMEINLPAQPLTGATGNIMMDVFYNSIDKEAYYLVWDTKTGKSVQYYWDGAASKWDKMEINLPAQPLPGATGEIGMKAYYDYNDKAAYYVVWDCASGKSIQYYWDATTSKWAKMEINLPADPLK